MNPKSGNTFIDGPLWNLIKLSLELTSLSSVFLPSPAQENNPTISNQLAKGWETTRPSPPIPRASWVVGLAFALHLVHLGAATWLKSGSSRVLGWWFRGRGLDWPCLLPKQKQQSKVHHNQNRAIFDGHSMIIYIHIYTYIYIYAYIYIWYM